MGYVIRPSWGRCLTAVVLLAAAASVLAPALYAYLLAAVSEGSGAVGTLLITGLATVLFIAFAVFVWHRWRYERDCQVCGIRLMGGPRVFLYFPAPSSHSARPAMAPRSARSAAPIISPAIPFPYDGHPAMAVTLTRVVHWPGCLLSLTFDSVRPADGALDRMAEPRPAPHVRPLLSGYALWSRRRAATVPMRAPRHLMIFADAMPAPQFRSLTISLACLQRGVTFVEHR